MLQAFRLCIGLIAWLCVGASHAVQVSTELKGVSEEMRATVQAKLELEQYTKRDISESQVRRLFALAPQQIRTALEPFGYYDPIVKSDLQRTEGERFTAVFDISLGEPVIVRERRLNVAGDAAQVREIGQAIDAFSPKVGERLDQGLYESSKARIDLALRSNGYLDTKLVQHRVEVTRRAHSASIDLSWDPGPRHRLGDVHFSQSRFRDGFLNRYITWKPDAFYSTDQLLLFQQRLVDADYFSSVAVQPLVDQAVDNIVPIDVLTIPAKRTVYSGAIFISTDTGPGARATLDRRWVNDAGHKFRTDLEYSERLKSYGATYKIPLPSTDDRSYNFGAAYRDEETDTSRSKMFKLAANESRRWEGFVRTLGFQYLNGSFEIAGEQHSTNMLYAEAVVARKRTDSATFTHNGYSITLGLRGAPNLLADTSFARIDATGKRIWPSGDNARVIAHAGVGALTVSDFDALPPELRFFAGGDRSIRGFDYEAIGETNESGGVIGGKYLAVLGVDYEHYFLPKWGVAVFADGGDAFSTTFDMNVGVGIGVRWRSPIGLVRLDVAKTVVTSFEAGYRIHIIIGPDL